MNKNRWLILGLIVSAAINIAFLASWLYSKAHPRRPRPQPLIAISEPLAIDGLHKEKISAMLRQFRLASLNARHEILAKRVEILEELGNPEFDAAKVREKTVELNALEAQLNNDFINMLLQVSDMLESRQRLDLIYRLSRQWYAIHSEKGGSHEK